MLNIDAKDVEAFSKIGNDVYNQALSVGMASILSSSNVLEVRVDGNFQNMQGKLVDVDAPERTNTDAGYVPYSYNINKHAQAVIGPGTMEKANSESTLEARTRLSTDGQPLHFTKAISLAHEIGHHVSNNGAVAFENAVRSRTSQRLRRAEN